MHREHVMDVAVTIDPGPQPDRRGDGYPDRGRRPGRHPLPSSISRRASPTAEKLAATRKSVASIEALGGVRVEDGPSLDKNGNLPILVETTERKRHAIGASAMFSNINGPALRAYWVDRNLFGAPSGCASISKAASPITIIPRRSCPFPRSSRAISSASPMSAS